MTSISLQGTVEEQSVKPSLHSISITAHPTILKIVGSKWQAGLSIQSKPLHACKVAAHIASLPFPSNHVDTWAGWVTIRPKANGQCLLQSVNPNMIFDLRHPHALSIIPSIRH